MNENTATTDPLKRKVRVGFTVAVLEDGEFVFSIVGASPGSIELYGLCEFAYKVIDNQMEEQLKLNSDVLAELQSVKALLTEHLNSPPNGAR